MQQLQQLSIMTKVYIFIVFLFFLATNCGNSVQASEERARTPVQGEVPEAQSPQVALRPAAFELDRYLPLLSGQRVALLVNQTSTLDEVHLVDTLLSRGVDIVKIFAPEHGFRGAADAGAKIKDGRDPSTGLPIKSLYGKDKKPSVADLADVDIVIFDIQDVGARFYTYISSLFYLLEAAGEQGKKVMVLDRPNPNGHYVDGPVLQPGSESFVGIAPIPVVHGLTVGEFARMAVGEGWLAGSVKPALEIVPMPGYTHSAQYELPVPPSPNLPNQRSIYLYPSLCFFEGTVVSIGRGTNRQFQLYGHPLLGGDFVFTPKSGYGSKYPKLENKECRGVAYTQTAPVQFWQRRALDLEPLLTAYQELTAKGETFFDRPDFFDLLAGGPALREAILRGDSAEQIRASWEPELQAYRRMRAGYLLYP